MLEMKLKIPKIKLPSISEKNLNELAEWIVDISPQVSESWLQFGNEKPIKEVLQALKDSYK